MSENTKIEWADHTFNPWEGCTKVGPGCDHCYAETRNARYGGGIAPNWGPGAPRRRTSAANWRKPLSWDRQAAREGKRYRVFCASLADVFENAIDPAWRADLFELIRATPNLDWLLLTKRIGNAVKMLPWTGEAEQWPHVWIGATVVNQAEADRDIPKLLEVPAALRFLSMEPLLGPVDLTDLCDGVAWRDVPEEYWIEGFDTDDSPPALRLDALAGEKIQRFGDYVEKCNGIDWVIVGGESGPGARPIHPAWVRSLRDQCDAASVPFLFKQWGEHLPAGDDECDAGIGRDRLVWSDGTEWNECDGQRGGVALMARVGKKAAGRLLDGVQHDGFPAAA